MEPTTQSTGETATPTILKWPDSALFKKAAPVTEVTDEIRSLAEGMTVAMLGAQGLGLAAPQVGASLRLIVVYPAGSEFEYAGIGPITLVNPVITETFGEEISEEGCLSVPGIYYDLPRPSWLKVKFTSLDGEPKELQAKARLARCVAHEVDHLDGVIFWDHLSRLKRDWLKLKFKRKNGW
jgi:peptide deformylase